MDKKTQSALEKTIALRKKGAISKALQRLDSLIAEHGGEVQIYLEAIEASLDSGEPLKAWDYFKRCARSCPSEKRKLSAFAKEKVRTHDDPIFARVFMERMIKEGDLDSARQAAFNLEEHTAQDLLKKVQVKRRTLLSTRGESGSFGQDLRIQTYCEALLALRTGRWTEAANTLVALCDSLPEEALLVGPFLEVLDEGDGLNPARAYVLGCCHLLSERVQEALDMFLASARLSRSFVEPIIERLERQKALEIPLPADFDVSLCELYMLEGDSERAAELISQVLSEKPSDAPRVLDLLDEFERIEAYSTTLHLLHIEAAILAKSNNKAIAKVKELVKEDANRKKLLEWLGEKRSLNLLPSELLVLYGELALEEKSVEKGLGALRDAVEMSPVDSEPVLWVLDRFALLDPAIPEFRNELAPRNDQVESEEELGIEITDRKGFSISNDDDPFAGSEHTGWGRERSDDPPPSFSVEFSLDSDRPRGSLSLEEEEGVGATGDTAEAAIDREQDAPMQSSEAPDRENILDEGQWQKSYEQGANVQKEAPSHGAPTTTDGAEEVIEAAILAGRMEEAWKLLSDPSTALDRTTRMLLLARYHMLDDAPLEALCVLRSIELDDLEPDDAREVLLKLASCYRVLHRFDAAHAALLELMARDPGCREAREMAKRNYDDYLKQQAETSIALEKTFDISKDPREH